MKKIVSIIMLTALLFTSITNGTTSKAISQYKRITSGNYEYAVLDEANKTATVLKIKPTKEVVIPKIIDGYSIVQIGICWNEYACVNVLAGKRLQHSLSRGDCHRRRL